MKYLLVSDIHGAWPTLEKVLCHFHTLHCDMLCILGDIINYGPRNGVPVGLNPKKIAEKLNAMSDKIVAIRGNCDSEVDQMLLDFPIMQDYMLLVDEGRRLLLTHGHIYNKDHCPKGHFDAIIYGHTHLWQLSRDAQGIVHHLSQRRQSTDLCHLRARHLHHSHTRWNTAQTMQHRIKRRFIRWVVKSSHYRPTPPLL